MRLLFVTTVLPGLASGGGEIVSQQIVDALDKGGHEVRVLGHRRPGQPSGRPGEICVGERPIETALAGPRAAAWMLQAIARAAPYSSTKYRSRARASALADELSAPPSLVLIDHAQALPPRTLSRLCAAPVVYIAHNVESKIYAELAQVAAGPTKRWLLQREARLIERLEREAVDRSNQVWTLTEADRQELQSRQPTADVRTLAIASPLHPSVAREDSCDVALIGTWTWGSNATGLRWFADEVIPRLPEQVRVEVAGTGAEWLQGRRANVKVRGFVEDAGAFLASARVLAVPAQTGGGIQVKTLDAIATGRPVVTTSVGARGLGELPRSVTIEDQASGFAAAVTRLAAAASSRPDPGALAWSRDRRQQFDEAILEFCNGLLGETSVTAAASGARTTLS